MLVEREKLNITFDKEVISYVINDMRMIFTEKQLEINKNQVKKLLIMIRII